MLMLFLNVTFTTLWSHVNNWPILNTPPSKHDFTNDPPPGILHITVVGTPTHSTNTTPNLLIFSRNQTALLRTNYSIIYPIDDTHGSM